MPLPPIAIPTGHRLKHFDLSVDLKGGYPFINVRRGLVTYTIQCPPGVRR